MEINSLITIVSTAKYWILFALFIIEGPIVNFVASMISVTGVLKIYLVLPLAILGDIVGDNIYYFIGRGASKIKVQKDLELKDGKKMVSKVEHLLYKMPYLAFFIIKIIPGFGVLGLVYVGAKKYSYWEYLKYVVLITIAIDATISLLAYTGAITLKSFLSFLNVYQFVGILFVVVAVVVILIILFRNKIFNKILKNINDTE